MDSLYETYTAFYGWFWNEQVWLPPTITWASAKAHKNPQAVAIGDIYLCIPMAILLGILRLLFESLIARPFVLFLGVKEKKAVKLVPSKRCEEFYRETRKPSKPQIQQLAGELGWSTREVERWFRRRPSKNVLSPVRKATECSWRFLFYFGITAYGIHILHDKTWLYDLDECFKGIRDHVISMKLFVFYIAEIGMYISLLISQFNDVKRKDFWHNTIHHVATIILLWYSFVAGYHRIGTVIVFVHDVSDIFLEAAKVLHYAKLQKICDAFFFVFTIVFYVSRLYIYPVWVLHASFYGAFSYAGDFFVYRCMLALLVVLQFLHIYWAKQILTIVIRAVTGKGVEDVRSDEEYVSEEEVNGSVVRKQAPQEEAKKEM